MVKNDNIRIKRKKADFLLYGFSYLFLILAMRSNMKLEEMK